MHFDYYAATVPTSPEELFKVLDVGLEDVISEVVPDDKGALNYANSLSFRSGSGESVCKLLYGGSNGSPHVRASGVHSERVAGLLREHWRDHTVSRLDVAQDFDGPGTWEALQGICLPVVKNAALKVTQYGDFREDGDASAGRTWYFGSRQSLAMVRLYEKGKQMSSKARFGEPPVSSDWVRLELELKPQNRVAKEKAASLAPEQCWGVSHWTRTLSRSVLSSDVERVKMTIEREHDDVRALRYMIEQYAGVMQRVSKRLGGDAELFDFIKKIRSDVRRNASSSSPRHEQTVGSVSAKLN